MGIKSMYESFKKEKPKTLLLFKVGSFYRQYGEDARIMNHLFGFKYIARK